MRLLTLGHAKLIAVSWCVLVYAGATYVSVAPVLSGHHAAEVKPVCTCSGQAVDHCSCAENCRFCYHGPVSGCVYIPAGCGCGPHADTGVEADRVVLHLGARPVVLLSVPNSRSLCELPFATPYSIHRDPPEKIPLPSAVLLV